MALQLDTTLDPLTTVVPRAYARIEQVKCTRFAPNTVECVARYYQSAPGWPPNQPAFKETTFVAPFDPARGDPYAQGYAGAKALPEFEGAANC